MVRIASSQDAKNLQQSKSSKMKELSLQVAAAKLILAFKMFKSLNVRIDEEALQAGIYCKVVASRRKSTQF